MSAAVKTNALCLFLNAAIVPPAVLRRPLLPFVTTTRPYTPSQVAFRTFCFPMKTNEQADGSPPVNPPVAVHDPPAKRPCPLPSAAAATAVDGDVQLRVKLVHNSAVLPKKGSPLSAGYDLSACEAAVIQAGSRGMVKTGLIVAVPPGTYGRVAPRSGLAKNKGIDVGAGVIDADYRGEVGVILFNHGQEDFHVAVGERIAQLILEKICMSDIVQVDSLEETERGAGGFGSTGMQQ